MNIVDFFYIIGERVESITMKLILLLKELLFPVPKKAPPKFRFLRKIIRKNVTIHEFLSLKLQLAFLCYLFVDFLIVLFIQDKFMWLFVVSVIYFLYIRKILLNNQYFFLDFRPYRYFYYGISVIAFLAFEGYVILKLMTKVAYYYYAYLIVVFILVFMFRQFFKEKYGRDWTYGVVEEIKGDVVKVYVHDDIAANVKPGYYWVDKVGDLEKGRIVKLLIEERMLKGAVPKRIIEVFFDTQSSEIPTEPNKARE